MNESLLQENNRAKEYDPYGNPPSLEMAQTHRQATMVGALDTKAKPQFCPCCDHIVNKTALPLCFKEDDLLGLGVGYPLYYKITKYFLMILLGIFFISGSAIYFLMSLKCQSAATCLTFFGVPIINISIMEQNNLNKTQMVNTVTAVCIFGIVLFLKTVINEDIMRLVTQKNCPSHYTIMLQNVPSISNQQLSTWLKERFRQAPVEMNWAFAVQQLAQAHKRKQELQINRNQIKINFNKFKDINTQNSNNQILNQIKRNEKTQQDFTKQLSKIQEEIKKCGRIIESYQLEDKQIEKIGTVFVTFQKAETVNDILQEYQNTILQSFMKTIFTWVKKSRLQLQDRVIILNKAPAPRQIIWENLRFSYVRTFIFQVLFILIMCLMLGGALRVILFFTNYSLSYRIEGQTEGKFTLILIGAMISLIVVVINCLTRLVIQFFTYAKKYHSYTKFQGSFCLYYSIFYIVNSCCVVYIVHGQSSNDTKQLLLTDIHLIMLANAFSEPLFKLLDPVMWWRVFRRWYVSRLKPQENPYTQEYMNKLWQGHEISNADNYQYITRLLFITTWFSTVAPVGVLFSIFGLLLDYWISKILLVRYYKIPQNISQDIAKPTLMSLQLLPLIYILGILQFNYKISTEQTILDFIYASLHYGVTTVVLLLMLVGYLIFCKKPFKPAISKTYNQAKLGFTYNYDTTNPATKFKADLNYLYEVLKQNENIIESQRITEMINESQKSQGKMGSYKQDLYLLRMEMQKKLSSIDQEIELQQLKASQL